MGDVLIPGNGSSSSDEDNGDKDEVGSLASSSSDEDKGEEEAVALPAASSSGEDAE